MNQKQQYKDNPLRRGIIKTHPLETQHVKKIEQPYLKLSTTPLLNFALFKEFEQKHNGNHFPHKVKKLSLPFHLHKNLKNTVAYFWYTHQV